MVTTGIGDEMEKCQSRDIGFTVLLKKKKQTKVCMFLLFSVDSRAQLYKA